jgi:hypothetical protein
MDGSSAAVWPAVRGVERQRRRSGERRAHQDTDRNTSAGSARTRRRPDEPKSCPITASTCGSRTPTPARARRAPGWESGTRRDRRRSSHPNRGAAIAALVRRDHVIAGRARTGITLRQEKASSGKPCSSSNAGPA